MRKSILLFIILLLAFIWGNSILTSDQSWAISNSVKEFISNTLGLFTSHSTQASSELSGAFVRKLAHFVEFSLLGISIVFVNPKYCRTNFQKLALVLLIGILTATIDETIQIFSGRTSAVKDIWIDFSGYIFGVITAYSAQFLFNKTKNQDGSSNKC